MKRLLISVGLVVGVVTIAVVGYAIWFVRHAVVNRPDVHASVRPLQGNHLDIELAGGGEGVAVTEISLDRTLRDSLGLSPPSGFKAEPLPLEDGEKDHKDMVEFVATYNREKVRYTGHLAVTPGSPTVLQFPAEHPSGGSGPIELQYECKIGVGGSIGSVSVTVGKTALP